MNKGIKIKVNPLTCVVWLLLVYTGHSQLLMCSLICAVLHETAHIAAYLFCGAGVSSLEILPFGISAVIKKTDFLSCRAEVFCSACGPVLNLILCAFFIFLRGCGVQGAELFILCNFSYFLVNLLPVIPLDGGRILYFALLKLYGITRAVKYVKVIGMVFLFAETVTGVSLYLVTGSNISILMICVYLLVYNLTSDYSF